MECYSLLKQYLQNGHKFKSAWWSPLQFRHLKKWGHSSPCLVSNLEGLVFELALQYQENCQWYLVKCGPLYLTYLESYTLQEWVEWHHFQHFLHCGTPRFMFVPRIVAIKLPILKYLLISSLVFVLLWESQISSYMIAMSNLEDTLIILDQKAIEILLKIWLLLRKFSTTSNVIETFMFYMRYGKLIILKYVGIAKEFLSYLHWSGLSFWCTSLLR